MATRDADLSSLRIDRSPQGPSHPKGSRFFGKIVGWLVAIAVLVAVLLFVKDWLNPGIEVSLATASLTSPSQAHAVLTASGYVVARRKAAVASKGTGRLVFLGVEEGDQVKKDQVIARLEDADVIAAREQARQNLRVAEADLYDAKQNLERMRTLLKANLIAQAEFDVAEARYKRVTASIEAAKFALREAEVAVANTRIIAPFDGTVLKKNADVGEIVAPLAGAVSSRAAVVTIADMGSLEVEADVSEANITKVSSDQPCEIVLDAYPQHRYPSSVANIVPTADRAKATVLVKIKFKEYDRRVLPEMSAKITFLEPGTSLKEADRTPVLAVPAAAVSSRDGQDVVFQIENNHAVEVPVTVGRKLGSLVEITEGLNEGDRVIGTADGRLQAGVKVTQKGSEPIR